MDTINQIFIKMLKNSHDTGKSSGDDIRTLSTAQIAELYTNSALLMSVMDFIKEQLWLSQKQDKLNRRESTYEELLRRLFTLESTPLSFLKDYLLGKGPEAIKTIRLEAVALRNKILAQLRQEPGDIKHIFLTHSLKNMMKHFIDEENLQIDHPPNLGHKGPRLYRTFDDLDEILGIDYQLEKEYPVDHDNKERLYQGSGIMVQSGYSTILLALHNMNFARTATVIDLGSGYGRVGFVFSLLRPDLNVIGYEYVKHRVDHANSKAKVLELPNLNFISQDLSEKSFIIPDADAYYLYDPFSDATYQSVLDQIVTISKKKTITIITKGNAREPLTKIAEQHRWPQPTIIDEGNLCLFRSDG